MVHCHWEYDLRTSIQIADAVGVDQAALARRSAAGRLHRLVEAAVRRARRCPSAWARTLRGAKGSRISSSIGGARHPASRPAQLGRIPRDQAHRRSWRTSYGLPMATHNTGSQVNTYATCQWAASIRDYMSLRNGDRRRRVDGSGAGARWPVHQGRLRAGTSKPGLGSH